MVCSSGDETKITALASDAAAAKILK